MSLDTPVSTEIENLLLHLVQRFHQNAELANGLGILLLTEIEHVQEILERLVLLDVLRNDLATGGDLLIDGLLGQRHESLEHHFEFIRVENLQFLVFFDLLGLLLGLFDLLLNRCLLDLRLWPCGDAQNTEGRILGNAPVPKLQHLFVVLIIHIDHRDAILLFIDTLDLVIGTGQPCLINADHNLANTKILLPHEIGIDGVALLENETFFDAQIGREGILSVFVNTGEI